MSPPGRTRRLTPAPIRSGWTPPSELRLHAFNRVDYGEKLMYRAGQYKEAERQLRQAVKLWQRLANESGGQLVDVAGLAWARFKLAGLLMASNRFRERVSLG